MVELSEEQILASDITELYTLIRARLHDQIPNEEELKDAKRKVRWGIKIKFDIHDYDIGNYTEKPKGGIILIPLWRPQHKYKITDIHTEIEEREDLARKTLLDSITDEDIIKARD